MIADTLVLLVELIALFFGVAFLVHLSQRWLGEERLRRLMGGPPAIAALKGIGVGFVTPFCTYSAIPMLLGLRRAGVTPAGYVAFIVAAPVLDPVLFGALILIVGARPALIYVAVAFSAAMTLALVAERIDVARFLKPITSELPVPVDRTPSWQGMRPEVGGAVSAAVALLRSLGPILLIGVVIGLAIELLLPPEALALVAGPDNSFAIPVAAGLGTPLYFSTELFVPIADSLAAVGVGVGAIVALTIAGAGANIPEFVILSKLARARALVVFVGYVFLVAMVGGLLAQGVA